MNLALHKLKKNVYLTFLLQFLIRSSVLHAVIELLLSSALTTLGVAIIS